MLPFAVTPELQMTLLDSAIHIAAALVFAAALHYFEREDGRTYLRSWMWSWLAFALYEVGALSGRFMAMNMPASDLRRFIVSSLALTAAYGQVLWFMVGSVEFTNRRSVRREWAIPGAVVCLVIGVGITLLWIDDPSGASRRYFARVGIRAAAICAAFVLSAAILVRGRRRPVTAASALLPAALVLYGLNQLGVYSLAPAMAPGSPGSAGSASVGFSYVDIFLEALIGLGMLLWMLENERAERRADWERLAESEERYRTLAESAPDAILTLNADGIVLFANGKAGEMFGCGRGVLLGMRLDALLAGDQARTLIENDRGPARYLPWTTEMTARHTSGRDIAVEVSVTEHMIGAGRRITAIFRDVSERQRISAQLLHAHKMEAIGRLTGGIAHDFNNLLTAISGYAEISLPQLSSSDPLHGRIVEIRRAAERASDLTRKLLVFSRDQPMEARGFDLNRRVRELSPILQRLIKEDVAVVFKLTSVPLPVHADTTALDQVLLNLALNARDAMPGGGRLTISSAVLSLNDYGALRHPEARPGRFAIVRVEDTGAGIREEDIEHIFEPFFTTKSAERGTGLGLAIAYSAVQQHGGWIEVESRAHTGTAFSVCLPLTEALDADPETSPSRDAVGGTETILLVEDEEPVRLILSEALSSAGYRVLEAATGPAALAQWDAHCDSIDLLLCDIVMPDGISGFDLSRRLSQLQPSLRVILMSGYQEHTAAPPGAVFLAKPFSLDHLFKTIRRCFETPAIPLV